tara:strand:+ start:537 stop:1316 length:780 start_codon:yes stop_codon:yes gene_type:complete
MLNQHFYHEKIRKCVAIFGTLFNNIYVLRKNASGAVINQQKVPLSYAPKQKFLERIRETENMSDAKLAIKLPRMSFEISSIYFDPSRQLPKANNFSRLVSTDSGVRTKFFTAVPYILNFQLNILGKTNEDVVQIVEQILPFFNPSYTITMKPFSNYPDITEDIPISLIGISFSDNYEGAVEDRRTITYTLDFEIKTQFFGPISDSKIIRKAIVDIKDSDTNSIIQRLTVEPNPTNINIIGDSDFNTTTTFLYPGAGDSI